MSRGKPRKAPSSQSSSGFSSAASSEDEHISEHKREDLWKDSLLIKMDSGEIQLTGLDSPSHTVFARVIVSDDGAETNATIKEVVNRVVTESWRNIARDILQKHSTVESNTFPSAEKLLELGSIWLLDENRYCHGKSSHAHRIFTKNSSRVPDWNDKTLRVYLAPERFFAAHEVDWTKYCRGLLIGGRVTVDGVGGAHPVPVDGLPDSKDGVIVYEDKEHHFTIINKPGNVPVHPTASNHGEDVVSMLSVALQERHRSDCFKLHISVPQRLSASLDVGTHGLLAVATQPSFATYYTNILDQVYRSYKCLVCIPDADGIGRLQKFQEQRTVLVHYTDPKSAFPKLFVRRKPSGDKNKKHKDQKWEECRLRIKRIGNERFRAACVQSIYPDSVDSSLAHRLWGPESPSPAEDLGFKYVMEIEVEILNHPYHRKGQIRGQLAALGFPVCGDTIHGGGKSELYSNHHSWSRMALHCCELSFPEPSWKESGDEEPHGKCHTRELVASDRRCTFRHDHAWWSDFIAQYEVFHALPEAEGSVKEQ